MEALVGYVPLDYQPSEAGPGAVTHAALRASVAATLASLPPTPLMPALALKLATNDRCAPGCELLLLQAASRSPRAARPVGCGTCCGHACHQSRASLLPWRCACCGTL